MSSPPQDRTVLAAFTERVASDPGSPAIHYYGRCLDNRELDRLSSALAHALADEGVGADARVALSLQNTPTFVVALLATWKLGGVVVPVNPMVRVDELTAVLVDSGAEVLFAHPDMVGVVTQTSARSARPPLVIWSDPSDLAGDLPAPWSGTTATLPGLERSVLAMIESGTDALVPSAEPAPGDLAMLMYTSGTTGPSKGAMLTHANLGYQAAVTADWLALTPDDRVLTIAPFFHVTGVGMHLAIGLGRGLPLVLTYRFEPRHVLGLVRHYTPRFAVGTITAYIALAEHVSSSGSGDAALRELSICISGGAPVPAAVIDRYEREYGVYVRNGYGLTETASACVIVPNGERAPVDPISGAVSIGKPLPGVAVTVVADDGTPVRPGGHGEVVVRGPQVGPGYWNRPEETSNAFRADGLHTGDIGTVDDEGWIYLVDRKKDLIITSGYKVWPREVEDALYRHPAVAEAAVIGVPDAYRGESVHAFVVVRAGRATTAEELDRHCRGLLSAYKCPRRFEVVDSLPKSASGKILRRMLRDQS